MKPFNNSTPNNQPEQRFARLDFIRKNAPIAAIVSKITAKGNETDDDRNRRLKEARPSDYNISMVSSDTTQSVRDADLIFQLLPEMILVEQILTSSIISPKDLISDKLNYSNRDSGITSEINSGMIEIIRMFFENDYNINKLLPQIIKDALFRTGSYPLAILPESSIDKAINSSASRVTLESIADDIDAKGNPISMGYLGSPTENPVSLSLESLFTDRDIKVSAESYKIKPRDDKGFETHVEVYDNFNYLKVPELRRRVLEDRVEAIIAKKGLGLENFYIPEDPKDVKLESSFYKRKPSNFESIVRIQSDIDNARNNLNNPLIMKLPSESCIPIFVPGNPKDHLGYFIVLDETGHPINSSTSSDYYRQMGYNLYNNNSQVASQLLGQTAAGTDGVNSDVRKLKFVEAVNTYTNIIENDLLKRLKNGLYGDDVTISRTSEIYRVMFARSLANKATKLLFIPRELLTYFAFDYNDDGVGRSLTDQSKVLASIRAVMLFANTMAGIKNSIGKTSVKIQLDPKDRNPEETVEYMLHEFARHRRSTFPFGVYNPVDLVSYLANAGVDVAVTGNAAYPETQMSTEHNNNNIIKPDTDLEESLKKRHIQSFGLTPETVDQSLGVDFATSIVSNNILLSKRVLMYQEILTPLLEDFISKYVLNSGPLLNDLKNVIITNKEKLPDDLKEQPAIYIIRQFLQTLSVTLPAPDTVTIDNQMKAFETYSAALDKALDTYFSEEFLDEATIGEYSSIVGPTKAALKAYYLRKWLNDNNVLPELSDITMMSDTDDTKFNLLNVMDAHIEGLMRSLKEYMEKIKAGKAAVGPPPTTDDGLDAGSDTGLDTSTDTSSTDTNNDEFNFDDTGTPDTDTAETPTDTEEQPSTTEEKPKEETPKEEGAAE